MATKDELFERYERAQRSGVKAQTKRALRDFIESFADLDEKATWTRIFLEQMKTGPNRSNTIRHELYAEVIYPALAEGATRDDVWSWLWLWRTRSNLIAGTSTFARSFEEPEEGILKRCHRLAPQSNEVRAEYLAHIVDFLRHCVHEWPAGILYGMDGATVEQCTELRKAVAQARALDTARDYGEFLSDFEAKLGSYEARLNKG